MFLTHILARVECNDYTVSFDEKKACLTGYILYIDIAIQVFFDKNVYI